MTNDKNIALDDLLNQPLSSVADDGFTKRVLARAARWRFSEALLFYLGIGFACVVAIFFVMPLQMAGMDIMRLAWIISSSPAFSIPIAALILTLSFERAARPA